MPSFSPCQRRRLTAVAFFLVAALLPAAQALAADLPPAARQILAQADLPAGALAVVVAPADGGRPRLALRGEAPIQPASTMKLVTTYAALDLLGPAATFRTELRATGPVEDGVLKGDLVLVGGGDPRLTAEALWGLFHSARARGIRRIAGDLVLDRSALAPPPHDPGAFDGEGLRPYNAGPDGLLVNFHALKLTLAPDPARQAVQAVLETPLAGLRVLSRLQLTAGPCGDWRELIQPSFGDNSDTLVLSGNYAAACAEQSLYLSPLPPERFSAAMARALWEESGGEIGGQVRDGALPPGSRPVAAIDSASVGELVRDINKFSNNVMARQLFLLLGRNTTAAGNAVPAGPDQARERLQAWLAARGLAGEGIVVDNGSGLSRSETVTALGLARLLQSAWSSPVMPELLASLPVAGVDGTLKRRFQNSPARGRARLKTGSLDNVRALAGFVPDRSGHWWVVVAIAQHARARQALPALDAVVDWVAGGRP